MTKKKGWFKKKLISSAKKAYHARKAGGKRLISNIKTKRATEKQKRAIWYKWQRDVANSPKWDVPKPASIKGYTPRKFRTGWRAFDE
jgi:hypothetical protein